MIYNPPRPWVADLARRSPLYAPVSPLLARFEHFTAWPTLADYQRLLDEWPQAVRTLAGKQLKIVAQNGKPDCFEAHYAPRIYQTGEIQTRAENWHDFFQFLTWLVFPKTKALINSLHLPSAKMRFEYGEHGRRSPLENMLSLFDEGGVVIISCDESLLQLIRDFQWQELFWQRRVELETKLRCVVFGHALYEKGLAPYIGMTANCILLPVVKDFFVLSQDAQRQWLDEQLMQTLACGELLQPRDLAPFPILGLPGYDVANECAEYYANTRYFRPGRSRNEVQDRGNSCGLRSNTSTSAFSP
ncbi:MAG: DUF3025 domain-containing protein [Gammaproteobacteria bacterium]|nr:DUF3025 domain-containing protein [Gammaproteobacteria bacterium]